MVLHIAFRKDSLLFAIGVICLVLAGVIYSRVPVLPRAGISASTITLKNYTDSPEMLFMTSLPHPVPVTIGHVENDRWDLTEDKALYLSVSGVLGGVGNTVIYGHNSKQIFGNLKQAKVGESIIVKGKNKQIYVYKITELKTVNANDVSILAQTQEAKLTVYTCTGFMDTKRLVVTAVKIA